MNYESARDYVWTALPNYEIRLPPRREIYTLDHVLRFLARLGNPQDALPVVYITGTKGKGSVAAMLESMLRAAGLRTGLYTSPHLNCLRERIQVGGRMIPRSELARLATELRPLADASPGLTAFELLTSLALVYFVQQRVDVAVIETGLGGALDATNVFNRPPAVSVIAPVSLDHTQVLGPTVEAIARSEAAIIRPGGMVVIAPQPPEARRAIEDFVAAQGATALWTEKMWTWRQTALSLEGQRFALQTAPGAQSAGLREGSPQAESGADLFLPLLGQHQLANAAAAVTVLSALGSHGIQCDMRAVQLGLARVNWPGRFEVLSLQPTVVADGAHNGASAEALADAIRQLIGAGLVPWRRVWFVMGIFADKRVEDILRPLLPLAAGFIFTQSDHPRALPPSALVESLSVIRPSDNPEVLTASTVEAAMELALAQAGNTGGVIATGSLSIAAEARALFVTDDD